MGYDVVTKRQLLQSISFWKQKNTNMEVKVVEQKLERVYYESMDTGKEYNLPLFTFLTDFQPII